MEYLQGYIESGTYQYRIMKRCYNENLYDLFIQIKNECYRFASYNVKTERLTIPFPKLFIPPKDICEEFIKICDSNLKEK